MAVRWKSVPDSLQYLKDTAEKYSFNEIQDVSKQDQLINHLTPEDIKSLKTTYNMIVQKGDLEISDWLNSMHHGEQRFGAPSQIVLLFSLFNCLSERHIEPFCFDRIQLHGPPKHPLDWSRIPESLDYIKQYARLYDVETEEKAYEKVDQLTGNQILELKKMAKQFNRNNDMDVLMKHLARYPITEYPESTTMYFFLAILDDLGFI